MGITEQLEQFYKQIMGDTVARSSDEDNPQFLQNGFLEVYGDILEEAAELGNITPAFYKARGVQINGYSINEDDVLTLVGCIFEDAEEPFTLAPSEIKPVFNRLMNFFEKAHTLVKNNLIEESLEAYDLAKDIEANHYSVVNLVILTNGLVRSHILDPVITETTTFTPYIWDLERIFNLSSSTQVREKIKINVREMNGGNPLYFLTVHKPERSFITRKTDTGKDEETFSGGFTSYLGTVPGMFLYQIYDKYNARLLEKNVRAFLQAKTKVNKGIRNTIHYYPEMFLAYNNGISCTAEGIKGQKLDNGLFQIEELHDFQIVNGGQTTASLYAATGRKKSTVEEVLKDIDVQVKITVLENPDHIDDMVGKISEYSNTQNRIQTADFTSNNPFHQKMESLSRSIWAPSKTGGEKQTQWFYERTRGQYENEKSRSKPSQFRAKYPPKQKFDKLKLARIENLWEQRPDQASKGGQASHVFFISSLKSKSYADPDETYYKKLIAKLILYKRMEHIVKKEHDFQAYWSAITDYTFAYISWKTGQRLDLLEIWRLQEVPAELSKAVSPVTVKIDEYLRSSANGQNVLQWAKKKECFQGLLKQDIEFNCPSNLLVGSSAYKSKVEELQKSSKDNELEEEMQPIIKATKAVDGQVWWDLAVWGKGTGALKTFQNGICASLGKYTRWDKTPSMKQAKQAAIIARTAVSKGASSDDALKKLAEFAEIQES